MSEQPFWREQYDHVIDIYNTEGDRFWTRFNVGLAVNTGLIGVLSYIFNISPTKTGIAILFIVSILGVVLASMWLVTTYLSRKLQHNYRVLGQTIETAHEAEIGEIKLFTLPDQKFTVTKIAHGTPIIFIAIWLVFVVYSAFQI